MDWNVFFRILNIVALLGGGVGFAAVLRYLVAVKKINADKQNSEHEGARVDFNLLLSALTTQRDEAWTKVEAQEARMEKMEAEISGLRLARDLDPFPNWVVDKSGEYLYVNREFERHFLEPNRQTYRDIVGKRHSDIWAPAFCRTLQALDTAARSRPDGTARATTALSVPSVGDTNVTVHKFPIRFKPSGVIVAYAGFITDIQPTQELVG